MLSEIGNHRTVCKLQFRLLPLLFALYVVAFIDRINLGFAALTMSPELRITSVQFGLAVGIFFWGHFLFEVPSNLILHKIGARVCITRILITWGAVATLTGFVQSANQLYVARFALGLAEAGYCGGSEPRSPKTQCAPVRKNSVQTGLSRIASSACRDAIISSCVGRCMCSSWKVVA